MRSYSSVCIAFLKCRPIHNIKNTCLFVPVNLLRTLHSRLGGVSRALVSLGLSASPTVFFSVKLDPELVAAASAAASTLPNSSQAESQLLRQLRQHEAVTEAQKKGDTAKDLGYVLIYVFSRSPLWDVFDGFSFCVVEKFTCNKH